MKKDDNLDFKKINHECILQYDRIKNQYYLFVPISKEANINDSNETISLDPGIRTFLTGFSSKGLCEIGTNINDKIKNKLKQIDSINDNYNGYCNKKKIALEKRREKIKNLIDDLHWKTCNYLSINYKNIIIGKMSTKGIVSKTNNLNPMTKRLCYSLSHFSFRQKLKYKCKINNSNYIETDERNTSKTCSNCGFYDDNLGNKKIYDCEKCKHKIDRDVNGARNIMIKVL
jgi:putative transposase